MPIMDFLQQNLTEAVVLLKECPIDMGHAIQAGEAMQRLAMCLEALAKAQAAPEKQEGKEAEKDGAEHRDRKPDIPHAEHHGGGR